MTLPIAYPYLQALGWTLLHFLWQGAALALMAWICLRAGRIGAPVRYWTGVVTLAAMLVAPATTFLYLASHSVGTSAVAAARLEPLTEAVAPPIAQSPGAGQPVEPAVLAGITLIWLTGVALLSIRLAGAWFVARRSARAGVRPVPPEIHALARRLAGRLALERVVALVESPAVSVPMMIGWLKPIILLPAAAVTGLGPAQIEALLAHELAHVRRHDYLVNVLQAGVETLLFYHPAVWWVSRQIRREREHCCDDLAIAVCGDRLTYVTALADLAAMTTPRLAMAATGGSLVARVRRIVGVPDRHDRPSGWTALALAAMVAIALLPSGFVLAQSPALATRATESTTGVAEAVPSGSPQTRGPDGVPAGVAGGVSKGVRGRVTNGVSGGVAGGVPEGVAGVAVQAGPEAERRSDEELAALERKLRELVEQRATEAELDKQEIETTLRKLAEKKLETAAEQDRALRNVLEQRAAEAQLERQRIETKVRELAEQKKKIAADQDQSKAEKTKRLKVLLDDIRVEKKRMLAVPADYVIAEGDVVTITVVAGNDRLTASSRTIGANGAVTLPVVGTIKVGGLTSAQAKETLQREFAAHHFGDALTVNVSILPVRR